MTNSRTNCKTMQKKRDSRNKSTFPPSVIFGALKIFVYNRSAGNGANIINARLFLSVIPFKPDFAIPAQLKSVAMSSLSTFVQPVQKQKPPFGLS